MAVAAAILALVNACAVGPDFNRPRVELPPAWTAVGGDQGEPAPPPKEFSTAWWEGFDDPQLTSLVVEVFEQNLDIEAAGLRVLQARAGLAIAFGNRLPQSQSASGSLTAIGLSENDPSFFPGADDQFGVVSLGFDSTWELDFWGRFRRGVEAAVADFGGAVAAYDAVSLALIAETASTYVAVRTLQELYEVTRENVALQQRSLEIADVLARNERTTELDVEQARTLAESTRADLPTIQADLQQALNALSLLLGEAPGRVAARIGIGKVPAPEMPLETGVPAELLRRRPDVRVAELEAAAQSARVGIAQADRYPAFGLSGSVGLTNANTGSRDLSEVFAADSLEWTLGPFFSWPVFNYGRLINTVRVEDAALQESLVAYRTSVLSAAREVEDAIADVLGERAALTHVQASADAARRAVDLALLQYREGIADYQRVLDTQRTLNSQQQILVRSRGAVADSVIGLYLALGGGWELRERSPLIDGATIDEMRARTNWGALLDDVALEQTPTVPEPASEQPFFRSPLP
ncbi:MAG: efflux transporter outer membrane subunit [Pseudomonadota bacterium]